MRVYTDTKNFAAVCHMEGEAESVAGSVGATASGVSFSTGSEVATADTGAGLKKLWRDRLGGTGLVRSFKRKAVKAAIVMATSNAAPIKGNNGLAASSGMVNATAKVRAVI